MRLKRTLTLAMILSLILTSIGSVVSAQTAESVPQETGFVFSDSFDNPVGGDLLQTGQGVSLDSNWRSKTTDEGNMGSSNTATFGFADGTMQLMTQTNATAFKPTTSNQGNVPAIVFQGSREGLLADQTIKVKAAKTHTSDMWGVRFMVHNNGQNYYVLWFGGQYSYRLTEGGKLSWGLYKCSNGTVTLLQEQAQTQNTKDVTDGYMGTGTADLTITMTDGNIAWSLDYAKGDNSFTWGSTYTDKNPFQLSGNDATVWLCAAGSGTTTNNRYIKFNDFSMQSEIFYLNGKERDTVVYQDISADCDKNGEILDLGEWLPIRKLLYSGESTQGDILVSSDGETWYHLTSLADFQDGQWLNTLTASAFRYVKAETLLQDLTILTDVTSLSATHGDAPLEIYLRMNGEDVTDLATVTSDNEAVATVNGRVITLTGIGSATIVATLENGSSISIPLTVRKEKITYPYDYTCSYALQGREMQLQLTSKTLYHETVKILVCFYRPDGSLLSGVAEDQTFDNKGIAALRVSVPEGAGVYAKCFVFGTGATLTPLASAKIIN